MRRVSTGHRKGNVMKTLVDLSDKEIERAVKNIPPLKGRGNVTFNRTGMTVKEFAKACEVFGKTLREHPEILMHWRLITVLCASDNVIRNRRKRWYDKLRFWSA